MMEGTLGPPREVEVGVDTAEPASDVTPACPQCGSSNVAWILRGYPMFSPELEADLASGSVALGGCTISPGQASHRCNACELEFRSDGRPVRVEQDDW